MKKIVLSLFAVALFLVLFTFIGGATESGFISHLKDIIVSTFEEIKIFFGLFSSYKAGSGVSDYSYAILFSILGVLIPIVLSVIMSGNEIEKLNN